MNQKYVVTMIDDFIPPIRDKIKNRFAKNHLIFGSFSGIFKKTAKNKNKG